MYDSINRMKIRFFFVFFFIICKLYKLHVHVIDNKMILEKL